MLMLCFIYTLWSPVQYEIPPVYLAKFSHLSPVIDGKLDDACWQHAQTITDFALLGKLAMRPTETTRVCVLFDTDNLYFAVECEQFSSPQLVAHCLDRDGAVYKDDSIEIFISTTPDAATYLHFAFNPLGTQYDAKGYDRSWDVDWKVRCLVGDRLWTAEVLISFASLGVKPQNGGDLWRMNICRTSWMKNIKELHCWSQTGTSFHVPERFGQLVFGDLLGAMRRLAQTESNKLWQQLKSSEPLLKQAEELRYQVHKNKQIVRRLDVLNSSLATLTDLSLTEWRQFQSKFKELAEKLDGLIWDLKIRILLSQVKPHITRSPQRQRTNTINIPKLRDFGDL